MAAANRKRRRLSSRTQTRPSWTRRALSALIGFRLLRTGLLILLFLVTWVALNYQHLQELGRVNATTRRLHQQADALAAQNAELRRLRDALADSDNREVIERLAREEELLTYPGEVLVYIEQPNEE